MPDCAPFRLYIGDDLAEVVKVVGVEIRRAGGSFGGDAGSGSFSVPLPAGGALAGRFTVKGKSVAIDIRSRPAGVSCGTIESKLQDYILDAKAYLKNRK